MIRLRWVLPLAAVVATTVAGCGQDEAPAPSQPATQAPGVPENAPPVSGPVSEVQALCGVQGLYWHGTWWIVDPPIQAVKNETSTRRISGTMTTIGNNQARLDSPDLVAPQTLSMEPGRAENAPPFVACSPLAP